MLRIILTISIDPIVDPYGSVGLVKNPDGSFTRLPSNVSNTPASDGPTNPFHLSKDIIINQSNNVSVRLFVPRKSFDSEQTSKLPILVYFHAGGFVALSAATPLFYNLYNPITTDIPAIIISVEYRLAPEHHLPAAYYDSMEALHWIKNSNDQWLTKYGDVSNCFLMGSSAGGNIAYNVGLHAASVSNELKPMEIKGLILHFPFFGGVKRTHSELRLANDTTLPLILADISWDLCLPIGANRDHEYSNPIKAIKKDTFDQIKRLKWRIFVKSSTGDPLIDRQMNLVKKLKELKVPVMYKFDKGGSHCYDISESDKLKELIDLIKKFVKSPNWS